MSEATKKLDVMHGLVIDLFTDILKNGEEVVTDAGEVIKVKPKAATLSVIRQFLKDNKVEADPKNPAVRNLCDDLPDFDEDGTVVPLRA